VSFVIRHLINGCLAVFGLLRFSFDLRLLACVCANRSQIGVESWSEFVDDCFDLFDLLGGK
jgi:hypothetical protein